MSSKIFYKSTKKIIAFMLSILLLMSCTVKKQISLTNEEESLLTSKTIILHSEDRTYLFYNVKSSEKELKGSVTSTLPFSNTSSELHIFLNSNFEIPASFPAELTIRKTTIEKIEIYESNTAGTILVALLGVAAFTLIIIMISFRPNFNIGQKGS